MKIILPKSKFATKTISRTTTIFLAADNKACKPVDFLQLKKVIYEALTLMTQKNNLSRTKKNL